MFAQRLIKSGLIRSIAHLLSCSALAAGLSLIASSASLAQVPAGPVVTVTGGQVQGRLLPAPGGAVFQGIPYAAPPIGDLRWRETQPVKPWSGVLQAGEYRLGCGALPRGADPAKVDIENCLYLNVWSPEWSGNGPAGNKKPVMFWINGGGLMGGSGVLRDGAESLPQHGVVMVSANYRGNLMGMMGHPELTAESPHRSSAMYGAFDEIAVLNWIQKNIEGFGGDPNNVTVFGQSGGGHMISMLLASPRTKGLIHKAIINSGAPYQAVRPYLTLKELENIGVVAAEVLKAPPTNQIKYLRTVPAAELVKAMPTVRTRLLQEYGGQAYDWGADGYALPQPANEVWDAHKETAVPLLVGSTGVDSGSAPAGIGNLKPDATPEETRAWKKIILEKFYAREPDLLQRALQIYGVTDGPNQNSTYPPYGTDIQQLGLDLNHKCSVGMTAAKHSAIAPTWQWEFTRTTPGRPAAHGSELRYIFGYTDLDSPESRKQSSIIQQYWTNFAKTGDPNGSRPAGVEEVRRQDEGDPGVCQRRHH